MANASSMSNRRVTMSGESNWSVTSYELRETTLSNGLCVI